ncbi:hypothetical protein KA005_19630, partial [bacterium]|nr:hypothetical protein [bacterium]
GDFRQHQANAGKFLVIFGLIWVAMTLIYMYNKDKKAFNAWWVIPVLAIVGYSTYFVIFLRAGLSPPINENDPSTAGAMMDYLARKQYGEHDQLLTFFHRQADFWHYQINKMYTRYFGWQFIGKGTLMDSRDRIVDIINLRGLFGLPFLVGLWGAIHHFFRDRKRAIAVLVLFFLTGYAVILYLNQPDPQPRERDYSYVGSFFAFSIWIGIGMAGILEWLSQMLRKRRWNLKVDVYGAAVILLVVAVPLRLYSVNSKSHSRKGNYVAWDYSHNLLETCEDDAILFTNGDNDTFPLWYLQEVEGFRKDVRVVNLSLLNTPWYIKQLRDQEPKVPINLTDSEIDSLSFVAWKTSKIGIPVPPEIRMKETEKIGGSSVNEGKIQVPGRIDFILSPTYPERDPHALRIQDIMIIHILQTVQWKRPVYFSIAMPGKNLVGLHRYLRLDGLAYRLLPYPTKDLDPEILKDSIIEKYRYRGVANPDVYMNVGIIKQLVNLRQCFLHLVRYYLSQGRKEEALIILEEMSERMPEVHLPFTSETEALYVAYLYKLAGQNGEYKRLTKYVLNDYRIDPEERIELAKTYAYIFLDWDRAEIIFRDLLRENSDTIPVHKSVFQVYHGNKQYYRGIQFFSKWLNENPNDSIARVVLKIMREFNES